MRRRELLATLIPVAILGIGAIMKWAVSPNAVRDFIRSGRAFGAVLLVAVAWLGLMWLLWRFTNAWVRGGVMTVVSLGLVVALVLPSARDTEVVEQRDDLGDARTSSTTSPPGTRDSVPTTNAPPGPVQISTGALVGIGHDATGTANLFRDADGGYVIELLDIDVEPGPDYFVYLVPGSDQRGTGDGIDLGALRGNVGTQYYDAPDGTDLDREWTVLIWCRSFAVPIANATQQPA